jgi:hypothetical protein
MGVVGVTVIAVARNEALRLARELLPDEEAMLGADHADAVETREAIVALSRETEGAASGGEVPAPMRSWAER